MVYSFESGSSDQVGSRHLVQRGAHATGKVCTTAGGRVRSGPAARAHRRRRVRHAIAPRSGGVGNGSKLNQFCFGKWDDILLYGRFSRRSTSDVAVACLEILRFCADQGLDEADDAYAAACACHAPRPRVSGALTTSEPREAGGAGRAGGVGFVRASLSVSHARLRRFAAGLLATAPETMPWYHHADAPGALATATTTAVAAVAPTKDDGARPSRAAKKEEVVKVRRPHLPRETLARRARRLTAVAPGECAGALGALPPASRNPVSER